MAEINDGGPAFPMLDRHAVHRRGVDAIEGVTDADERDRLYTEAIGHAAAGMTLRDYFAAKAMAGMLADPSVKLDGNGPFLVSKLAYEVADAMLHARGFA